MLAETCAGTVADLSQQWSVIVLRYFYIYCFMVLAAKVKKKVYIYFRKKKKCLQHDMDLYHKSSTGLSLPVDGLFQELDFDPPCAFLPVQDILRYPTLSLLFFLE